MSVTGIAAAAECLSGYANKGIVVGYCSPASACAPDRVAETPQYDRMATVACAAVIILLVVLIALPTVGDYRVADSYRLVGRVNFAEAVRYLSESTGFGRNEYRPVIPFTYAVDHLFWGSNPVGYHWTNVVIHALNGVLLLLIVRRMTANLIVAVCSAILFAVHPSNHSRIAWIAARDSSVCLLFLLASWLAYLNYRSWAAEQPASSSHPGTHDAGGVQVTQSRISRLLSYSTFGLALLSYEGAVAFPFVIFAMEAVFANRRQAWTPRFWAATRIAAPYFILTGIYVTGWLWLFRGSVGAYDLDLSLSGAANDFLRLHNRLFYHVDRWFGLIYLAIAYLLWRYRDSVGRLAWFSILVLWIGHLPFIPIRGYAERFGFLSVVGVALLLSLPALLVRPARAGRAFTAAGPAILIIVVAGFFASVLAQRMQRWAEAGDIARSITAQVKSLHPTLPPDAQLIFENIPARHGEAYVFPLGFRAALEEKYTGVPLNIVYSSGPVDGHQFSGEPDHKKLLRFVYQADRRKLIEAKP